MAIVLAFPRMPSSGISRFTVQCLAVALCAWGVTVILQIAAHIIALTIGSDPGAVPSWALVGTWAVLAATMIRRLMGQTSQTAGQDGHSGRR